MHLKPTLVLATALIFHSLISAQVTVLGKLSIGDSNKLQLVTTNRGDQLVGWISAWSADSIVLVANSNLRLAYPVSEVSTIEEVRSGGMGMLGTQIFELKTTDGRVYHGYPTKMTEKLIFFDANKAGLLRLRPRDVEYLKPETVTLVSDKPYENEYDYAGFVRRVPEGKLLGYSNGQISHRAPTGQVYELDIEKTKKYSVRPPIMRYEGQGRSLMFAPTGFGMKEGEKEYRNIMVGLNIFSFALSDHVSVGTGLISFIPYADFKLSQSFGKYVHGSVGVYGVVPFSIGVHGSISLGTPDYFLNFGYLNNIENEDLYYYNDFESFNFGASMRVGRRSRVFAEYNILNSPKDRDGDGYDVFWERGFGNAFTWGYGWYNTRLRFETGLLGTGPYTSYCSFSNCNDAYYYVPIPYFSMAVKFRR